MVDLESHGWLYASADREFPNRIRRIANLLIGQMLVDGQMAAPEQ